MNKTAIITGASGGIGSAIAETLANEGYSLVLLGGRNTDALRRITDRCRSLGVPAESLLGDLGSSRTASSLMQEAHRILGHTDCLVNCAGISRIGLVTDVSDEEWHHIMESNLSSVFYCCRSVIPAMVHEKKGRILNISSVWGSAGASCEAAYSASKGGMNAFTKALAKELAPSGIAVNALACGVIDTAMNQCFSEEERRAICEEIPAGRMGTPEETGEMAALLLKAPVYLTGQIITMDGGWC